MKLYVRRYIKNNLIAIDQMINTVFGGNPDETMSSSLWHRTLEGETWACVLCRILDIFQKDHCEKSYERKA